MTTTPQHPIGSGFSATSTADEVIRGIDLTGKTAIVTGGYAGLGLETTRVLHQAGARVIVPARDLAKAARNLAGTPGVEIQTMDLLDPVSIDAFARRFLASGQPLSLLINNAGVMALPDRQLDARGYEHQFATNHLGHFQLATRLWPALVHADGARIISLSSRGHRFSPVVFEDLHFEHRPYDRWLAYGQSKTANVLFAIEADRRGRADGIRAFAVHPGGILTDLARHLTMADFQAFGVVDDQGNPIENPAAGFKTIPQGAATQVWCATNPSLAGHGGVYCEDVEISPVIPDTGETLSLENSLQTSAGVHEYAINPASASRLWTLSEMLLQA